jgi:hypothetical protein
MTHTSKPKNCSFQTCVVICTALFLFASSSCHFKNKQADLIIHNAKIYTVNDMSDVQEAMAIKDGKIVAIGPEREILNEYDAAQTIDAGKRFIYPGFIDAHCHFLAYGRTLQEVNLVGSTSFEEVLDRVQEFEFANEEDWIKGRGWDQNDWVVKEFPTKDKLDSLYPNTPCCIASYRWTCHARESKNLGYRRNHSIYCCYGWRSSSYKRQTGWNSY